MSIRTTVNGSLEKTLANSERLGVIDGAEYFANRSQTETKDYRMFSFNNHYRSDIRKKGNTYDLVIDDSEGRNVAIQLGKLGEAEVLRTFLTSDELNLKLLLGYFDNKRLRASELMREFDEERGVLRYVKAAYDDYLESPQQENREEPSYLDFAEFTINELKKLYQKRHTADIR